MTEGPANVEGTPAVYEILVRNKILTFFGPWREIGTVLAMSLEDAAEAIREMSHFWYPYVGTGQLMLRPRQ